MCDESFFAKHARDLTRRQFGTISLGAGVAMLLPRIANALEVTSSQIEVETPDGLADCYFAHPVSGSHPGVVVWPDARGIRPTYQRIAERLAESGYSVLAVNPYYRSHRGPVLGDGADPRQGDMMSILRPLLAELSPETERADATAMVKFLDTQAVVDANRRMGTLGFCLGGPATFRTAAQFPERVGAGASFHGVRLVTDAPTSPHLLIPRMNAKFLIAIAEDDDENDPEAKRVLREAFEKADLTAEIEVYEGAMHSWTTPDSPVHHPAQAERAWNRMLALLDAAL